MYKITKTDYGLHIVLGGRYNKSDIVRYITEKEKIISTLDGTFSILVDARTAIPAEEDDMRMLMESQEKMISGQLERMAVIVNSPVVMSQARQVGLMSGSSESTRFINASKTTDWEKLSLDWVAEGIEPFPETELANSRAGSQPG